MSKMLRCALSILLALSSLLIFSLTAYARPSVEEAEKSLSIAELSAQSAVLTDENGNILFEKDAHRRMGPASTTKIMTALTVLSLCQPDDTVTIPREAVGVEGSSVYLCEGEALTVAELLYALLLASANDAAVALALFSADSVENFCQKMNEKAASLGLSNTHFTNPHGLYDEAHYTTAHDLAIITAAALKEPLFRQIVSTYKTTIPLGGSDGTRVLVNHNKLLRLYDGCIGVKTGFTKKTGRTLVSAAERDGLLLIAVTLDAPNDWNDHAKLLDYGFANYACLTLFQAGDVVSSFPVCGGQDTYVALCALSPISLIVSKEHGEISYTVESYGHFLYAPIQKGDSVARAVCRYDGHVYSAELLVASDVARDIPTKKGPLYRLLHFFSSDSE